MVEDMDIVDKFENLTMIAIFFLMVLGIFIFSCVINRGEEDFWIAVTMETLMESLILGIGFLLLGMIKKLQERKQSE